MKKVFGRVASCSRKIFSEPHYSTSHSYLLAVLDTLCETYPGKVLSRELLLPSDGFMEVDTHVCWYNDVSLLVEQMNASILTRRCGVYPRLSLEHT